MTRRLYQDRTPNIIIYQAFLKVNNSINLNNMSLCKLIREIVMKQKLYQRASAELICHT